MPETVREPTRIFSQSRAGWSAGLLVMGALALFLGVFGAVRLQRDDHAVPPPVIAQQTPVPAQSAPSVPTATAAPSVGIAAAQNSAPSQTLAPRESQAAAAAPTTAPTVAARATPTPAAAAAAPSVPVAAPPAAAPSPKVQPRAIEETQSPFSAAALNGATTNRAATVGPRYWVEFGAYTHAYYAQRLKDHLQRLGIQATITTARGAHGREYLRVRTTSESARPAALADWSKAHRALRIRPLLHRVPAEQTAAAHPAGHQLLTSTAHTSMHAPDSGGTYLAGATAPLAAPPGA